MSISFEAAIVQVASDIARMKDAIKKLKDEKKEIQRQITVKTKDLKQMEAAKKNLIKRQKQEMAREDWG